MRHHEPDGPQLLLEQVRDEARGARQYRHAFERGQRIARIEEHGGYRAGDVQSQGLAEKLREYAFDLACDERVSTAGADLFGDVEQPLHTRIEILVQGVPVAGD